MVRESLKPSQIEAEVTNYIRGEQEHQLTLRMEQIRHYIADHFHNLKSKRRNDNRMEDILYQQIMAELSSSEVRIQGIQLYPAEEVVQLLHTMTEGSWNPEV